MRLINVLYFPSNRTELVIEVCFTNCYLVKNITEYFEIFYTETLYKMYKIIYIIVEQLDKIYSQ